jgi:beta-galactosidase
MADRVYGRRWEAAGRSAAVKRWKAGTGPEGLIVKMILKVDGFIGPLRLDYRFGTDGRLHVSLSGRPFREMVRFGTRMGIPARFRKVSWYGRGPQACYADRKTGALIDTYSADADELDFSYLMPQESGNRTDVRRVSFSDGGTALVFSGEEGRTIDFSASFASREAVARALHAHEIERSGYLHVNIDAGQRGVGGSIPGVLNLLPRYRMKRLRKYRLACSISGEVVSSGKARKTEGT